MITGFLGSKEKGELKTQDKPLALEAETKKEKADISKEPTSFNEASQRDHSFAPKKDDDSPDEDSSSIQMYSRRLGK